MHHVGSCHCGAIKFTVDGQIDTVTACNCSICQRKGSLLWFVPAATVTIMGDETDLTSYTFNKHHIKHQFCKICGMHPFGRGTDPKGNEVFAVNVRCLEAVDLDALTVNHFNGRAL